MKRNYLVYVITLVLFVNVFTSCSDDENNNNPIVPEVTYEYRATISLAEIQLFMQLAGLTELREEIKYGVDIYYMEYPFTYLDKQITASGLVCVPISEGSSFPVLSFQHGTITKKSDAPSASYAGFQTKGLAAMAGAGYVVSIPDLVGFGASDDYFHPYFYKKANAEASIEMLNALNEIPEGELSGVSLTNDLYLSGYSQGGWITLALLEAIEKSTYDIDDWEVKAAACGAGPHDPAIVMDYVFALEEYPQSFYMPYVVLSFKEVGYDIGNLNKYFQEPYATNIPGLYDGTLSGGEINSQLTSVTSDFYTQSFLNDHESDEFSGLNYAMVENSISAWNTDTPVLFIHGDSDTYVPKETSITMYETMVEKRSSDVAIELLPGLDHTTAAIPSIEISLLFFKNLE